MGQYESIPGVFLRPSVWRHVFHVRPERDVGAMSFYVLVEERLPGVLKMLICVKGGRPLNVRGRLVEREAEGL